ncbi:class I SAM-dependent methyltransferase [Chlorogloeopsis sp. ULAP01]|uniref:class I SAM-dependent methyltransferase n=1 Tax=Chlorogloeopsis sp. ULAP01 TaxID=3056483 RepID=UPI0025AA501E|nr:class I SAM-dependent methyltransferase [Chlorogloeopsis sp. ULAP01]MDM9383783.1 class I SAM-dependent methyltransferase [Chlorogloeopsis sp. ULAP01]
MNQEELSAWFVANKTLLENAYTVETEPWKQSGFSGPYERWITCRKPIADCVDQPGNLLDIGCANGYLLECLLQWTAARGINIQPYGLDISTKLADLAKQRLPNFTSNIFIGNAWTFVPPLKFDFVRTELLYVPESLREGFVRRLLELFVQPNGKLLVAEYRSSKDTQSLLWVDDILRAWNFKVDDCKSGYYKGKELTRIAVIKNY